jgi:hypothetical protein
MIGSGLQVPIKEVVQSMAIRKQSKGWKLVKKKQESKNKRFSINQPDKIMKNFVRKNQTRLRSYREGKSKKKYNLWLNSTLEDTKLRQKYVNQMMNNR